MKLWIDDIRPAPEGYTWCRSTGEAIYCIERSLYTDRNGRAFAPIELIDIDHDAGDYAWDGGDYIKLLDWMEETGYTPRAIHIHSMNPVGVQNMRRIIQKNGWTEVQIQSLRRTQMEQGNIKACTDVQFKVTIHFGEEPYEKASALLANRTFPSFREANSYLFSTMQKWGDKFPHAVGTINEVWYYSDQPIIPHDAGILVRIDAKLNQF